MIQLLFFESNSIHIFLTNGIELKNTIPLCYSWVYTLVVIKLINKTIILSEKWNQFGNFIEGPLAANTNPSIKRRRRVKVVGTVLRAVGAHKWDVQFDFDGKSKEVHSKSLVNVPESSGIPLDEQTDGQRRRDTIVEI